MYDMAVASETKLFAGPFKVTIVAHKIVQLMSNTIQEAVGSGSTAVVQSTCNGVLEIASLFIAVPDPRLKQQLQQASALQLHAGIAALHPSAGIWTS